MGNPRACRPVDMVVDAGVLASQRQINEMLATLPPYPDPRTPAGLAVLRQNTSPPQEPITSSISEITIAGPGGDLRLRVLTPPGTADAVMVRIHGGGWAAGAPQDDDTFNDRLAIAAGLIVVSPDYRLVPEATRADGTADCTAALRWVADHAQDRFGAARLLLAGNSAGASHAAQALLALRDTRDPAFAAIQGLVLDCGIYDASGTPGARAADEKTLILPHDFLFALLELGAPGRDLEQRRDPSVSPLYAELSGLPPALFLVGGLDPLADDSRFMCARWTAAGNAAELDVWPEGVHAFANTNTPLGGAALRRIAQWVDTLPDSAGLAEDTAEARTGHPDVRDPVSIVRRYLDEVVNGASLETLDQLWAVDGQWHGGSLGDKDGLQAMLDTANDGAGAFSGMHLSVDDIVACGDKVVVRFTNSGVQTGPFLGLPATGRHASWLGIGIYTVTDAKIGEAWFGEDILGMLLQLGVVTLPA